MIGRFQISPSWLFVLPAVLLGMALEHRSGAGETPCPIGAPAEIHYSPAEDLAPIDVALLRGVAKQIDMTAYGVTDRAVVEALALGKTDWNLDFRKAIEQRRGCCQQPIVIAHDRAFSAPSPRPIKLGVEPRADGLASQGHKVVVLARFA